LASKVKSFSVYWFLFQVLHLDGHAFHVLSGGTICGVSALTSAFTVSNFLAIPWARFLLCGWFFATNLVLWCGCQSSVTESFVNLKMVEAGWFGVFFF
jgi:hypothetical protein